MDLTEVALQLVAGRTGLERQALRIANTATANYPLQGQSGAAFKIENTVNGALYGVMLDTSGRELDPEQLARAEQAAYRARYGRLHPDLAARLAGAPADKPIDIIVWLKEPPYRGPARHVPGSTDLESKQAADAHFAVVDAQRATAVEQVATPVADRLRGLGYAVETDTTAPVLFASLRPDAVRQVETWDETDLIYLSRVRRPTLDVVRGTIGANYLEQTFGLTGWGIPVAQIEVGGRVATLNPYLAGITEDTSYQCNSTDAHGTAVAGIIRSTHAMIRGIAPDANLWAGGSCQGKDPELLSQSSKAADWGARVLNLSFGGDVNRVPDAFDRWYESMVRDRYRTVVVAAGNEGAGCIGAQDGDVLSPGLAYNVITVGNFNDRNTTDWSDDTMDSCSSWRDPISSHGDREKPEIAAPGENIKSTSVSPPWAGLNKSGTSFAAPAVTGGAALLMQHNPSLQEWPEAVKALLMAGALNHNIEGDYRLSEYDGAGAVDLNRSDLAAVGKWGNWGGVSYTCSAPSSWNVAAMGLEPGNRTRIVIAWDTSHNYYDHANRPGADLDLQIVAPNGAVVASSVSWDNTYEIVDYTPPAYGNYTLRIVKYRCDYDPAWLGFAWKIF